MIQFFTELLGPYPFEAYGVAVMDVYGARGLETQTLTILDVPQAGDERILLHELAHHWAGNSVTPATWQDIWLNEGFATYCEWLWAEQMRGKAAFDHLVRAQYTGMKNSQMWAPGQPPPHELFHDDVYVRGAWVFHALRLQIGDEAFFRLVRTWFARYQYSNASTQDFMALAEEVSGQTLGDLFERWLYTDKLPPMPELPHAP
jgi:aminopeptidase N